MTPASYAKGGKGAQIGYAITDSPLGRLMVAATENGICFLSLGEDQRMIAELEKEFSYAKKFNVVRSVSGPSLFWR